MVVPAFNETASILEQSLGSIGTQTFVDFECIVVDESTVSASARACAAICSRDERFRHVRPRARLGLAGSLNLGIALARGELVARFDSDDVCTSRRLELQVAYMDAHPEIGVLGGGLEIMNEAGVPLSYRHYPTEHAAIERQIHSTTPIAHPTVMVRKHLLETYGGYDPTFRFAEDLDLWLRLMNHEVRFANLKSILVRYRQDHTRRQTSHWHFNVRARRRNLAMHRLPRRLLGICAISVWARLPAGVQEALFKALLLRRSPNVEHNIPAAVHE
jgi:glycosyltransferase involved in cell wall biosynthesis